MASPIAVMLGAWRDALLLLDAQPLAPRVEELEVLVGQLGAMYRRLDASPQPYPAQLLVEARDLVVRTRTFLGPLRREVQPEVDWR
jgi:hypothetical protein